MKRIVFVLSLIAFAGGVAAAADHPVAADKIRAFDKSNTGRRFFFRAGKEPNLNSATIADPRTVGGTLEVFGSGGGDGNTGAVALAAENWRGLGHPAGNLGYEYRDHSAAVGVTRISLQRGAQGGILMIAARGPSWPYAITQPQTDVMVRLTIGSERYCAKFTSIDSNRVGAIFSKANPIIADCN